MGLLKKVNTFLSKKDVNEENLNTLTQSLFDLLNKLYSYKQFDYIIITYIYDLYKKIFNKQLKAAGQEKSKNPKQKSQGEDNIKFKDPIQYQVSTDLLLSFIKLSLLFIIQDKVMPGKINVATLSFIHKLIEEGITIHINGVKKMVYNLTLYKFFTLTSFTPASFI